MWFSDLQQLHEALCRDEYAFYLSNMFSADIMSGSASLFMKAGHISFFFLS